jgi:hypothetical protein
VDFTWSTSATRPDDLLSLTFHFANFAVDPSGTVLRKTGSPAAIALVLPPQHLLEGCVDINGNVGSPPLGPGLPAPVLASAPTRLVFLIPDAVASVDYSIPGILAACAQAPTGVEPNAMEGTGSVAAVPGGQSPSPESPPAPGATLGPLRARGPAAQAMASPRCALRERRLRAGLARLPAYLVDSIVAGRRLAPRGAASIAGQGLPRAPMDSETGVEVVTRLVVSPNEASRWLHATAPFTSDRSGRTEVWRTRLGTAFTDGTIVDAARARTTLRAIWTRDPDFDPAVPPAPVAHPPAPSTDPIAGSLLQPGDRAALVHQSSNWGLSGQPAPTPFEVHALALGALGGTMRAAGAWPNGALQTWRQHVSSGRDEYVLVTAPGFLLPYGHRATRITIAERWVDDAAAAMGFLRQYELLAIEQPLVAFDPSAREHPFTAVELLEKVTPPLTASTVSGDPSAGPPVTFFRYGSGEPLLVPARAVDRDGQTVALALPVGFTSAAAVAPQVASNYNAAAPDLRTLDVRGARVAFVPSAGHSTALETQSLLLEVQAIASDGFAPVKPRVAQASVVIEAARHFAGSAGATVVSYVPQYVAAGFPDPDNVHEAFLQLAPGQAPVTLSFQPTRSAGLANLDMGIAGLSRTVGLLGGSSGSDIATSFIGAANGGFDPKTFFGNQLPHLFGVLSLVDLLGPKLDPAEVARGAAMSLIPKCVTESLDKVEQILTEAQTWQDRVLGGSLVFAVVPPTVASPVEGLLPDLNGLLADLNRRFAPLANNLRTAGLGAGATSGLSVGQLPPADLVTGIRNQLGELVAQFDAIARAAPNLPIGQVGLYREVEDVSRALLELFTRFDDVAGALDALQKGLEAAKELRARVEWRPILRRPSGANPSPIANVFMPVSDDPLLVSMEVRAKARVDPTTGEALQPGVDVLCALDAFELWVFDTKPVVKLKFDRAIFRSKAGRKPEVDVVFGGLEFGDPLGLLNKLKDIVPLDGLSDPPYLDEEPDHLAAGFTLSVPNAPLGLFALRNIKLSAGVIVPFLGSGLSWSFQFCSKKEPFNLTISFLGGGGYLALSGNASGLQVLDASLEFGAYASLDLGVASGELSVAAGAYLELSQTSDATGKPTGYGATFTGFLRIRGAVQVLGLIGISVELTADLTYVHSDTVNEVVAHASITVEVDIGPFSTSVGIAYQTSFEFEHQTSDPKTVLSAPAPSSWLPRARAYEGYLAAFARAA